MSAQEYGGIDRGRNKDEILEKEIDAPFIHQTFREQLDKAVAEGIEHYLKENLREVFSPKGESYKTHGLKIRKVTCLVKKLHFILIYKEKIRCLAIIALMGIFFIGSLLFSIFYSRPTSVFTNDCLLPKEGGKLAIIIDDFGSSRAGIKEMMAINRHLTFAVMPFSSYSQEDAKVAHEKGYEVIVHLPMEANYGKRSWLGSRPILAGMKKDEIRQIVRDAFEDVPFAIGANIHMGSKASSDENIISAVLDIMKEKDVYFVDSRTADHPISKKIADAKGVRCYDRNIFLDGQQPKSFVKARLMECADLAVKKGYAVAIGHVGVEGGKVTAEAICEMLPEFDRRNIELVFVSELD